MIKLNNTPESATSPLELVIERLESSDCRPRPTSSGYVALCPAHDDHNPSLNISEGEDGRALLKCFVGCTTEAICAELGLTLGDLFPGRGGRSGRRGAKPFPQPCNPATTASPAVGCTLAQYAGMKGLPAGFLQGLGLSDLPNYSGHPAVRIPYRNSDGSEGPVRFRLALAKGEGGDNRFVWKKGSKPTLYGLDRLDRAHEMGYVILVEGESDCHTLWHHGFPSLGIPGASNWNEGRDARHLDGIAEIYIVVEPDKGGETVKAWLATSAIRDRARLITLGDHKDTSALHLADTDMFTARFEEALEAATPWSQLAQSEADEEARAAWDVCQELGRDPDILARFAEAQRRRGVAGEERAMKLVFLALQRVAE